ncbi:hypothetical protein [Luteimicrobium subarcticum]|uniref:Uncharacterized protein n=1 Tax=Luteimicrobium subarcticum TaxID=620910 RepID=A0A2M8WJ22_9MICO|nr:hypothetical protein [Luteimicrobium subarcticum]PJI90931.1 hypothetical protein CLV34_2188 [Luteimicrobium subarcticum]
MTSHGTTDGSHEVRALTRELANYTLRLSETIGCPESDVWAVHLAASGRMLFPGQAESGLCFPDGPMSSGGATRYEIWRVALREVLDILGPVECRLRTGYDLDELTGAMEAFFETAADGRTP